jgi:hypothetical protein
MTKVPNQLNTRAGSYWTAKAMSNSNFAALLLSPLIVLSPVQIHNTIRLHYFINHMIIWGRCCRTYAILLWYYCRWVFWGDTIFYLDMLAPISLVYQCISQTSESKLTLANAHAYSFLTVIKNSYGEGGVCMLKCCILCSKGTDAIYKVAHLWYLFLET